jgi:hypothetical protein
MSDEFFDLVGTEPGQRPLCGEQVGDPAGSGPAWICDRILALPGENDSILCTCMRRVRKCDCGGKQIWCESSYCDRFKRPPET